MLSLLFVCQYNNLMMHSCVRNVLMKFTLRLIKILDDEKYKIKPMNTIDRVNYIQYEMFLVYFSFHFFHRIRVARYVSRMPRVDHSKTQTKYRFHDEEHANLLNSMWYVFLKPWLSHDLLYIQIQIFPFSIPHNDNKKQNPKTKTLILISNFPCVSFVFGHKG